MVEVSKRRGVLRDSLRLMRRVGALPSRVPRPDRWLRFARDVARFVNASREPLPIVDLFPMLGEDSDDAGTMSGHYFHQDLWAARLVRQSGVARHVDVGSRIDGFVAHCSLFTQVEYVDIRPLEARLPNISFVRGSILELPFESRSQASVSSLHVIEHIGLGRYGDPIDPEGTRRALRELQRVVAPGGSLLIGCPIGRSRICFNAHRVLSPSYVPEQLDELVLERFAAVDDAGDLIEDQPPSVFDGADYACGLYHLRRPQ